jgi:hypothetical protein
MVLLVLLVFSFSFSFGFLFFCFSDISFFLLQNYEHFINFFDHYVYLNIFKFEHFLCLNNFHI